MKKLLALLLIGCSFSSFAQVAINTDGSQPAASSILDIKSNSQGVLLPRMTATQRKAIITNHTDAGLLVFDTDYQTLFMYDGTNWMPLAFTSPAGVTLVNRAPVPQLSANHEFGEVVTINGNYAFVRSGSSQNDEGSVYVFERTASGWAQMAELRASDQSFDRHFGGSIAVYGDYAVIGIHPVGVTTGAAYVFTRTGGIWTEQIKLTAPDGVPGDMFGHAVAISNDVMLIGAPGKDVGPIANAGAVYVYKRSGNNWIYATQFTANGLITNDGFGEVIAMHNNYAVVGITKRTVSGASQAGIAQVFFYNGSDWAFQATLSPSFTNTNSHFGASVAICDNRIAVGQPGATVVGKANAGRATVFARTGNLWSAEPVFTAADFSENDLYGASVAINNGFLLVGTPGKPDAMFAGAGATYVYKFDPLFQDYLFNRLVKDVAVAAGLNFGKSVAIDPVSNSYIIGSPGKRFDSGQVSFGYAE